MDAPNRRLLAVLALGVLPWNLVGAPGAWTAFLSVGFVNLAPPRNLVTIYDYVFVFTRGLPEFILAWPLGLVMYIAALGAAIIAVFDLEDPRVTAGLLALFAVSQAVFARGFASRSGYTVIPIATITAAVVVWWFYWPLVRESVLGGR
jgi:uncharacterized protein (TIGR04206 family)